jgi:hypothetical protein
MDYKFGGTEFYFSFNLPLKNNPVLSAISVLFLSTPGDYFECVSQFKMP